MKYIKLFEELNKEITIGFDVDGVLNNFVYGFNKVYKKYFPEKETTEADTWLFYHRLDYNGEDPDDWFFKTKAETWEYSIPYEGVSKRMNEIYDYCKSKNIRLVIITSQPNEDSKKGAIKWLKKNNIPYDGIFIESSKYKHLHCDIMVDDGPKVIDNIPENKVSIKINRKWNEGIDGDFNVDGIKNLTEDIIEEAINLLKEKNSSL